MHIRILIIATLATGACHNDNDATPDADITTYDCASDDRAQVYVAGLQEMGASKTLSASLVDAEPAPPTRGNNTWMVQLATVANGSPVTDATISATPFMPDHQHGTPILVGITNVGSGQYQLTPVNLWMPGYWVTTLAVSSPTMGNDTVQFKFCLPD